nr:ATP-binding protein [Paraburkholderia fungorum]
MPAPLFANTLGVISADGQVIAHTGLGVTRPNLLADVIAQGVRRSIEDGLLIFDDKLGSTGWRLVYAVPWREVAVGVWPLVVTTIATTAFVIGMTWFLLLLFNRRVFVPVLERSQRVFDSERLNRTVIRTTSVGLGLIARKSGDLLLDSPVWTDMATRVSLDGSSLAAELLWRYPGSTAGRAHPETAYGAVTQQDVRLVTAEGESISLAVSFAPGRYQGEDVLVTAFVDVTAKARLEQQLRQAKQAADQANAAKSMFVATMSHEIRTPLNAILGNLELLAHSRLDAVQQARLDTVRNSSDGLLAVIRDVLDFSKIEAGEIVLERIGFDAAEVASAALMAFAPVARAKDVSVYAEFGASYSVPMTGDPTRLRQILNNLLSNAIKFTLRGSVTLRVATDIADGARMLRVEVEDTGIGMTEAQQATVFQAFAQADASINRRYGGTGLGLALCGRLVGAMGGTIGVQSEPERGSRFTVHLPLGLAQDAAGNETDAVQQAFAGEPVTLLASDRGWLHSMTPLLEGWGLTVSGHLDPSHITGEELEAASVLMLCGDHDQWPAEDENRLMEQISRVIACSPDGPLHPVRQGRIVSLSCYTPGGLRAAFRHVLHGVPLPAAPLETAATEAPQMARRMKVLVAEDNEVNRQLFAEQLAMLQCDGHVTASGQEALQALSAQTFDVLLTDLNMPGMNGYELTQAVRQRWPELPVIAVTAGVTQTELARCREAGMTASATKPMSLGGLYDVLTAVESVDAAKASELHAPVRPDEADAQLLTGVQGYRMAPGKPSCAHATKRLMRFASHVPPETCRGYRRNCIRSKERWLYSDTGTSLQNAMRLSE